MKNLTENQELLLAEITNEFLKINQEKATRKIGGLLDVDTLLFERDMDIEYRNQIEIENKIAKEKFNNVLKSDMDRLNEDLDNFNLIARIDTKTANFIVIEELTKVNKNLDTSIWIKYSQYMNYINFKSKIEGIWQKKGFYIEYANVTYKSIEDFVKNEYFNEKLRILINNTIINN
jgi:hypothetical protein